MSAQRDLEVIEDSLEMLFLPRLSLGSHSNSSSNSSQQFIAPSDDKSSNFEPEGIAAVARGRSLQKLERDSKLVRGSKLMTATRVVSAET